MVTLTSWFIGYILLLKKFICFSIGYLKKKRKEGFRKKHDVEVKTKDIKFMKHSGTFVLFLIILNLLSVQVEKLQNWQKYIKFCSTLILHLI